MYTRLRQIEWLEPRHMLSVDPAWFAIVDEQIAEIAVPGDYDGDFTVDTDDYTVWRNTYGQFGIAPGTGADGNRDGVINAADYVIWRDNRGKAAAVVSMQIANESVAAIANEWLVTLTDAARNRSRRGEELGSRPTGKVGFDG
jgi:hypothetical protein